MLGNILEIATPGCYLCRHRGFLEVRLKGEKLSQFPLDDISALIISGRGATHSSNVLAELGKRNIPVAICDSNFHPVTWVLPIEGHHAQSARMIAQAGASKALKNGLWKKIIQSKITSQAKILEAGAKNPTPLLKMIPKVRSGDPDNLEAQAARLYWSQMFDPGFLRDRKGPGVNHLLNYAYAILRSCVVRATIASGLHPTLGLHHYGPTNSMCLVDDLMEPFRPLADLFVKKLYEKRRLELDPPTKRHLASITTIDIPTPDGLSPLFQIAARLSTSLAQVFLGERKDLLLPELPPPLALNSLFSSEPGNDA